MSELTARIERWLSDPDAGVDEADRIIVDCRNRIAALERALREIVAITDRKHEAWDRAKALLEPKP